MKTAHTIEQWPVNRLVPYDRNARTHSEAQVAQIAASITQFGFNNPILVDSSSGIIAGHGRLQAARKLGLASVPVIVLDHLTDAQRRAYILADNKLALNAGWDEALLAAELAEIEADIDLTFIGFDDKELERLLSGGEPGAGSESLAERFGVPPFSVLDARQGYWQDRKRAWLAMGIESELGRGDCAAPGGGLIVPLVTIPAGKEAMGADARSSGGGVVGRVRSGLAGIETEPAIYRH